MQVGKGRFIYNTKVAWKCINIHTEVGFRVTMDGGRPQTFADK